MESKMISFGEFLVSEERKQRKIFARDQWIRDGLNALPLKDMLSHVTIEDRLRWEETAV